MNHKSNKKTNLDAVHRSKKFIPKIIGYKLNNLIGKGSYGYVYRAEKSDSHEIVAIKCVPLESLGKTSRDNIINEISILKNLKHDFIVQLLDFQWDRSFVYMIFEYCTGGELASIIRLKRNFPENIIQHFLQQLASSMKYLRSNNIAHLDLKPQNILITGIEFITLLNGLKSFNIWRRVILKIADFGFAQYLTNDERINSLRGSPLYMAPEILKRQEYDARADLWSLGIILFECAIGVTPLHGMSTAEITNGFLNNQIKINLPKNKVTPLFYDLLKRLLNVDPKMRISFDNFFSHPFIDLEHMPTKDSLEKAKDIIKIATHYESQNNLKSAFYNFREALFYLMPLYNWGIPHQPISKFKQEELKSLIIKNMEKAEDLQQKCDLVNVNGTLLIEIQNIYSLIDHARDLASNDLYSQSLDKYQQAFELSLKIMKNRDSKMISEFFGEINDWMTEAETIKKKSENKNKNPPVEVEEKIIVSKEAIKLNDTKSDYYLKAKSNLNDHSKLKHIDNFPCDNQDREPTCLLQ